MKQTLLASLVLAAACSGVPAVAPTEAGSGSSPAISHPTSTAPVETGSAAPSPSELSASPSIAPAIEFDAERALALAAELAAMGARDAGTPGDAAARAWFRGHLEAAAWTVTEESVELPQGGTTANVIAYRDPADLERPHVVIGGHLDTRNQSPGANDNASGIGVLISAARQLMGVDELPIVVVGFGAEEYQPTEPRLHHLGSGAYALRRQEHVVAAMIVDMVGHGPATCICWFDEGPRTLADRLVAVADDAGLAGFRVEQRGDISDHGPFARLGIPAAFLWTYDDGRYHTAADTADHLQVEALRRAGDLLVAFVDSLTAADAVALRAQP